MSKILLAGAVAIAVMLAPAAFAQPPAAAPAAQPAKLTTKSSVKDLLANPKAKEIVAKYAAQVVAFLANPQFEAVIPGTTPLAELAQYPQAQQAGLTAENLKKIDEELAKL